jgi:hypothetical protein
MAYKLLSIAALVLVAGGTGLALARAESRGTSHERHGFMFGGPPPLVMQADANDDGAVDAAEWNALFASLDKDHDGKLAGDEIAFHHPEPPPEALAYFLAHGADGDDDRKITAAEWQKRVTALDADKDGALSPSELSFKMRHHWGDDTATVDALPPFAAHWDADGDGKLEASELETLFAAADRDGDGVLTEMHDHGRRHGG